jgi:hypothetical protein
MNYHLLIDHWFTNSFIAQAEKISPHVNQYVFLFEGPGRYVPLQNKGIYAPLHSKALEEVISGITPQDRVYVHWFQKTFISIINVLPASVPLYLFFWGGDFLDGTTHFFKFNFDTQTRRYLRQKDSKIKWDKLANPWIFTSSLLDQVRFIRMKRAHRKIDTGIKKSFLARLNYFCHWNDLDLEIVRKAYGGHPSFLHFFYGGVLDSVPEPQISQRREAAVRIWLGNSDAPTNNHLDAIQVLKKFSHKDVKVMCPLSYGAVEYGDMITREGVKAFGEKWQSLRDHVPLSTYLERQQQADVVVMYHNRTQASGNIMAFVKMGKKVFLKRKSTLSRLLKKTGILVFDAEDIKNMSFEEFIAPLSEKDIATNNKLISGLFSEEACWQAYERALL